MFHFPTLSSAAEGGGSCVECENQDVGVRKFRSFYKQLKKATRVYDDAKNLKGSSASVEELKKQNEIFAAQIEVEAISLITRIKREIQNHSISDQNKNEPKSAWEKF